ncbi:hypothetical protein CEXT_676541 [Caerostris extrusa]|uniref:Uncharacterized protein n=1 Tax=Caerostris extrusa TaxID=172846 RepID=A0AAV4U3G8_CAEEX|nr:hypothetical protein CEXT_676541 [Caerostris extrusa]
MKTEINAAIKELTALSIGRSCLQHHTTYHVIVPSPDRKGGTGRQRKRDFINLVERSSHPNRNRHPHVLPPTPP